MKSKLQGTLRQTKHTLIKGIDQTVFQYILKPPALLRQKSSPENLDHEGRLRLMEALGHVYNAHANQEQLRASYDHGNTIGSITKESKNTKGYQIFDLRWPSYFEPIWQDKDLSLELKSLGLDKSRSFREKFFSVKENLTAHARWYRADTAQKRPTLVCLHGYMGGNYALEEKIWPIKRILNAGFDIALMVLPFHAYRKDPSRRFLAPRFPSSDPRFTIESFRQTVFDYGSLKATLTHHGCKTQGIAGMSLGGYATALLSVLQSEHLCYLPIIPLGNLSELANRQNRLGKTPAQVSEQMQSISRLLRIIDATQYTPQFSSDKMHILSGTLDAITGTAHAQHFSKHFKCNLTEFQGGHVFRNGIEPHWEKVLKHYTQSNLTGDASFN